MHRLELHDVDQSADAELMLSFQPSEIVRTPSTMYKLAETVILTFAAVHDVCYGRERYPALY